jgi:hypothetical protein
VTKLGTKLDALVLFQNMILNGAWFSSLSSTERVVILVLIVNTVEYKQSTLCTPVLFACIPTS